MNGLTRRVGALEARVATDELAELSLSSYDSLDELARRVVALADRYRATPAPLVEQQSRAERIVRAALGAADGAEGDEYARLFWRVVAAGLRAYEGGWAA
jgi:hypothetical protein